MYQDRLNPPANAAEPGGDAPTGVMRSINLRDLWAPVYRSRFAIIAIFAAVFALAIAATLLIQPRYRATTTVEIRSERQKVLGTEDQDNAPSASTAEANRFLDTQLDIIKSRSTANAVTQSLGLANNNNFLEAMSVDPGDLGTGSAAQDVRRRAVVSVLLSNLRATFSEETLIAKIAFSSPDPALAQRVADSFADNYIRLNLARRFDASSYSLDFLRNQIREAQERLSRSERQAIGYARAAQLIDVSNGAIGSANDTGPQSLTTANLVGLNQALSTATAKRVSAEQRWNVVQGASLTTIPEVVANPTVQQLQQQRAQLRSQYEQELQTRREDHPAVRQLSARITALGGQITRQADDVKQTVREEYETARAQEQGLRRDIAKLKTTTLDEQARSIQLSILRREASTNRQQLDALLRRYNELNAQSGIQLNNISVIDRAEVPGSPYWPSALLNGALAIVASLLLSAGFVLGRENLFEMLRTPDDVTNRLRLPLLGAIPASEDVIEAMTDPKSAVSESINSIRTSLSLASASGVPRLLTVTSTQAGEGKSTACYGLAQGLAKLGRSVVIVDADLRRPNVHKLFGLKNTAGVSNVLSGNMEIDAAIHRGVAPGIDTIVAGPIPPDSAELLAAGRLRSMLALLSEQYDHVLVDSAPVLGLADAPLVASSVNGVIYVVEAARNSVRGIQAALNRLSQSGTPVMGVVLSRFDPTTAGYSYEYQYAYDYSYGTAKKAG